MIDNDAAVFKDGHSFSLPKKRTTLITARKQDQKNMHETMNDTASSVAHLSVFLFLDMMISTSDWITRSQKHFCGCWQTISVLMDWFPAEFTFCMILLPPSGTSPPGRPAQEYLYTRNNRTASAPLLLLYSLSFFLSVLFFLIVLCPLISVWGFFNAYSCPWVRLQLPSAVSLEESLPENNLLFFLLERIDQNVLRFEAKPRLSINIWWFETVWHWT